MKRSYLEIACAVTLGLSGTVVYANDVCLGYDDNAIEPIPNVVLPTIENIDAPLETNEGDKITLSAQTTVDEAKNAQANFYWCIEKGLLSDLTQNSIQFTAPAVAKEGQTLHLRLKVNDGLGYSAMKVIEIKVSNVATDETETVSGLFAPVKLSGHIISKNTGKALADVLLNINGLDSSATTDAQGYFEFLDLPKGDYSLTASKDGYEFASELKVTVDEATVDVTLKPTSEPIVADKSILIAKHRCNSNAISVNTVKGEELHRIDSSFTARGLYLRTVQFDTDDITDIAVGEIGQGKQVSIINLQAEPIGTVITNGDDKGVWVDFGDVNRDGTDEIAVTNQSKDNQINLYQANGKAIRPLLLFDKKVKMQLALGDVTGDGVENIAVVLAEQTQGDNVFVFDENGRSVSTFTVILQTSQTKPFERTERAEAKSSALVLALGDTDGDGKKEIIVAQTGVNQGFGVAVYDEQGALKLGMNAFGGKINKSQSQGCDAYQAYGVVLAAGDLNQDGKDEIVVAKAGGRDVRIFNGQGQLVDEFTATAKTEAITSLAISDKIEVPMAEFDVENKDEELKDIVVRGKADERQRLEDRTLKGTVKISYTTLVNVKVDASAHLEVGPGTLFDKTENIPPRLPLSDLFNTINIQNSTHLNINITPLDLNTSVVENAPTVLDDIKVLSQKELQLLDEPIEIETIDQQTKNGNLVFKGHKNRHRLHFELCPLRVDQADKDEAKGIRYEEGTWVMVTEKQQKVTTVPVSQDFSTLIKGLLEYKVEGLSMDENGLLRAQGEHFRYLGIASLFAVKLDVRMKTGVNFINTYKFKHIDRPLVTVNYDDDTGEQWQQDVLPTLADITVLRNETDATESPDAVTDEDGNTVEPTVDYAIKLEEEGVVSFTYEGQRHRAFPAYVIEKGNMPVSGDVEIMPIEDDNKDGMGDFVFIYANGERQNMFVIPKEQPAANPEDETDNTVPSATIGDVPK